MTSWIEDPGTDSWNGLNYSLLEVDQAYVNVTSLSEVPLWFYVLSDDCRRCPFTKVDILGSRENIFKFSTKRNMKFRISSDGNSDFISVGNKSTIVCNDLDVELGEFGIYSLLIKPTADGFMNCNFGTAREPVNIFLPLTSIALGLVLFAAIGMAVSAAVKKFKSRFEQRNMEMSDFGGDDRSTRGPARRQRVKSLDTFRGLSVVIMIFVNYGAGQYWFLEHATWDGLQIADCVFPWFMWIMGVCVPVSVKSQYKRGIPKWKTWINVLKRSIILFGLGLMLNTAGAGPDLEKIRVPGVLQRFGLVYFIVATMSVVFGGRVYSDQTRITGSKTFRSLRDLIFLMPQWIVILSMTAVYCYLVFWYPVPGCPSGYLGPGGIQDGLRFFDCVGGMTGYVDRIVLGENHIYQYPTSNEVYKSGPFDPEGLLGVIPSVLQVFLGVQAGSILVHHTTSKGRMIRWCVWGTLCAVLTLVLALPGIIPINKNLWSLSFVFATSGLAFYILSFIYFLQDDWGVWSGVPFRAAGMNPTILYVGHSVAYDLFPFHWRYGLMNTHFILTLETLWGTFLWIGIAHWLYHLDFFLSI